eukprot:CAMPEP_0198254820 /NCGR_PEP_ID=MMETSP1447-20131203/5083_1 /TAXON_ID=420782 /ORGANISM="Chaetoceros dichaeta, Strain CCMP1751" /LENGTH=84 /DNA_ID=CAMNT_0043941027 /DNA_START=45 /DNA_END=295 /DNA_ORIENTATION=-
MKYSSIAIIGFIFSVQNASAFTIPGVVRSHASSNTVRQMAMEEAAPAVAAEVSAPVVTSRGGVADVRYSDFLKMINGDKVEKVT